MRRHNTSGSFHSDGRLATARHSKFARRAGPALTHCPRREPASGRPAYQPAPQREATWAGLGGSQVLASGDIDPAGAANFVDSQQVVEDLFGGFLGIDAVSKQPVGISDGHDGQAVRLILALDHGFQGTWSALIT